MTIENYDWKAAEADLQGRAPEVETITPDEDDRADAGAVLVDDADAHAAWDAPRGTITPDMDALVEAVAQYAGRLVLVTPEAGLGVIPATRSGRLFRDEIGALNQRLAQVCDDAYFVVAGLPMRLK